MKRGIHKQNPSAMKWLVILCSGAGLLCFAFMWLLPQFNEKEAGWQPLNDLVEERLWEESSKQGVTSEPVKDQKDVGSEMGKTPQNDEGTAQETEKAGTPNLAQGASSSEGQVEGQYKSSIQGGASSLKNDASSVGTVQQKSQDPPASEPLSSSSVQKAPEGSVAINTAGEDELTTLPGIGPAKAKAIISYRKQHGPFRFPEDVLEVKGIGPKMLAKIKDRLYFGE
ncbi:ComEA family DNA-binding protein [Paenibacillus sp. 1001270B_150601_E10]|uniref:ComEA family DNA-binding protein n=1 Tax=Paenibacillus sp. 1001270B_150601_E10 TaxID=2787079 RepID=UPI001E614FCB|nr:helix-hairpin-helix domain-containing protein [Paenibacillus sp. 1001270B_150601_E10]